MQGPVLAIMRLFWAALRATGITLNGGENADAAIIIFAVWISLCAAFAVFKEVCHISLAVFLKLACVRSLNVW